MDYPGLKRLLKSSTTEPTGDTNAKPAVKPISDEDEEKFQTEMRKELDKVVSFHRLKTEELRRRIDDAERVVESILANPQANSEERRRKTDEVLKEVGDFEMRQTWEDLD
jgi:SPX domain protein involved in polyphosphate accumulation